MIFLLAKRMVSKTGISTQKTWGQNLKMGETTLHLRNQWISSEWTKFSVVGCHEAPIDNRQLYEVLFATNLLTAVGIKRCV